MHHLAEWLPLITAVVNMTAATLRFTTTRRQQAHITDPAPGAPASGSAPCRCTQPGHQ
ncbi:hypothetical protein Psi01_85320 [Planobispora siamensis]|uniref:Uncharacterized protein n=1 Tax=Planobispora siamensis TaxID=936338 RepID=A0A8J3SS76_9ACTN|nr:hypothetical protein Psi01_85320 [Planobispora siamensis]